MHSGVWAFFSLERDRPASLVSSRDYHAYRSQAHRPGDLVPIANTNHYTDPGSAQAPRQRSNPRGPADDRVQDLVADSGLGFICALPGAISFGAAVSITTAERAVDAKRLGGL